MTSGFEVIVRPVILPDIRPQSPRVLPPPSDPASGIATIGGGGGQVIQLSNSEQHSWSQSKPVERKRTVDVERVYQQPDPNDPSKINKSNYVDLERVKRMTMNEGGADKEYSYQKPKPKDNIEILETGKVIIPDDTA